MSFLAGLVAPFLADSAPTFWQVAAASFIGSGVTSTVLQMIIKGREKRIADLEDQNDGLRKQLLDREDKVLVQVATKLYDTALLLRDAERAGERRGGIVRDELGDLTESLRGVLGRLEGKTGG